MKLPVFWHHKTIRIILFNDALPTTRYILKKDKQIRINKLKCFQNLVTFPAYSYGSLKFGLSPGFSNIGPMQWRVVLSLAIAWLIVFLSHVQGARSSAKVRLYFERFWLWLLVFFLLGDICNSYSTSPHSVYSNDCGTHNERKWKRIKLSF